MISLARRLHDADSFVRAGQWNRGPFPPTVHLAGRKAGIIGLGYIGLEIARRCAALQLPVECWSRTSRAAVHYAFKPSIDAIAAEADFLFLSCRGGQEMNKFVGSRTLELLGPNGFLINVAQARFVDEDALIEALRLKRIAGAAVDVFVGEPKIDPRFREIENVILSPHIGSITRDVLRRRSEPSSTSPPDPCRDPIQHFEKRK